VITVTSPRSFCYGLGLTLLVTLVSFAIAHWGFGNLHYLAQLLPVFMTLCVLLAWLLYLRKTGFLALDPKNKPGLTMGYCENAKTKDLPEDKISGINPIPVLLWSAVQIAVLSIFLYEVYGIGSRFHL
jgi:hypothetical protein